MSDEYESDYMNGPTEVDLTPRKRPVSSGDHSLSARFKSLFS